MTEDKERLAEKHLKYQSAVHSMQAGVAMLQGLNGEHAGECSPKHLRVGVNSSLISNGALVDLLVEKGVFTTEEYLDRLIQFAQMDVESYISKIKEKTGTKSEVVLV